VGIPNLGRIQTCSASHTPTIRTGTIQSPNCIDLHPLAETIGGLAALASCRLPAADLETLDAFAVA